MPHSSAESFAAALLVLSAEIGKPGDIRAAFMAVGAGLPTWVFAEVNAAKDAIGPAPELGLLELLVTETPEREAAALACWDAIIARLIAAVSL